MGFHIPIIFGAIGAAFSAHTLSKEVKQTRAMEEKQKPNNGDIQDPKPSAQPAQCFAESAGGGGRKSFIDKLADKIADLLQPKESEPKGFLGILAEKIANLLKPQESEPKSFLDKLAEKIAKLLS